jgi:hypothetical protein
LATSIKIKALFSTVPGKYDYKELKSKSPTGKEKIGFKSNFDVNYNNSPVGNFIRYSNPSNK